MKLKSITLTGASLVLLNLTACQNSGDNTTNNTDTAATKDTETKISVTPVDGSPTFPGATLKVKDIKGELQGADSVKITINYEVNNYELKKQTGDASAKECNNSKDGQHIHFILDNKPYKALYEPTNTFTVAINSEHYLMSFLSRSYHESLKNPEAGVLTKFSVDSKGKITQLEIPQTPMIFYSRPKGDYIGDDTKNVLLDFYVYNGKLATDAYKVKATINGQDFTLVDWKPYFVQNMPMGEMNVRLQLLDKDGNNITGDNTDVMGKASLATQEPMK
jgi:hypothetical protein